MARTGPYRTAGWCWQPRRYAWAAWTKTDEIWETYVYLCTVSVPRLQTEIARHFTAVIETFHKQFIHFKKNKLYEWKVYTIPLPTPRSSRTFHWTACNTSLTFWGVSQGLLLLFILFLSCWHLSTLSLHLREKIPFLWAVFSSEWFRSTDILALLILNCTPHFCWEETTRKNRWGWQPSGRQQMGERVIWKESKGSVGSLGKLKSAFLPVRSHRLSYFLHFSPLPLFCPHPSYQAQKGATCSSPILHFPSN